MSESYIPLSTSCPMGRKAGSLCPMTSVPRQAYQWLMSCRQNTQTSASLISRTMITSPSVSILILSSWPNSHWLHPWKHGVGEYGKEAHGSGRMQQSQICSLEKLSVLLRLWQDIIRAQRRALGLDHLAHQQICCPGWPIEPQGKVDWLHWTCNQRRDHWESESDHGGQPASWSLQTVERRVRPHVGVCNSVPEWGRDRMIIYFVRWKAAQEKSMEFEDWKIDDDLRRAEAEDGRHHHGSCCWWRHFRMPL